MNEDKLKGQWKQLHGKLKSRWGKLTDDDIDVADGNAEYLVHLAPGRGTDPTEWTEQIARLAGGR